MKLLILSNNPDRASFRQRIEVYLDIMRDNGIDSEIAVLPRGCLARRKLFTSARSFDAVFLHKKTLNFLDACRLRKFAKRIIYDFDDAVMFDDKRPDKTHHKRAHYFRRTVRLANLIIAGNPYLAEQARQFSPNVVVLPTGLDTKKICPAARHETDGKTCPPEGVIRLVWIGSKTTLRYLVEIAPALEEIGSRFDNVVLRVISDKFPDLKNIFLEKRLWSLETELTNLAESDIGLAPLPDNLFTKGKCGFKILQYASFALPVVASPVGINANYVQDGVTGFWAENSAQWIEKISALVQNPQLRENMGWKGRQFAQQFDISVIGRRLCEIITSCIEKGV